MEGLNNSQDKRNKKLDGILRYLSMERVHVPNIIFVFKELGWSIESNKELYLGAIQIGFYDVINKLKDSLGTGYTADSIGHWGHHIGWKYIESIKPFMADERVMAIGDSLTKLLAKLYELSENPESLVDFYKALGMIEKVSELENKTPPEGDKRIKLEDDNPGWQEAVREFLEVADKYEITSEEREQYIKNIKETVEKELAKRE